MTWNNPYILPTQPGIYAVLRKEGPRFMFWQPNEWRTPIFNNQLQHVGWSSEPFKLFPWHEVDPNQSIQPHEFSTP